ncbi:MAG: hypothetical protein ABJC33_07880 [Betaproteobacteria bacterium]
MNAAIKDPHPPIRRDVLSPSSTDLPAILVPYTRLFTAGAPHGARMREA